MRRLVVVKLGGSVITYKDSVTGRVRLGALRRISREISQLYRQGYKLVVVHGAGSFGHPIAKKYQLVKGMHSSEQKLGFAEVSSAVLTLNNIVLKELLRVSVPAVGISSRSFVVSCNGSALGIDTKIVKQFLAQNCVPVLFGDAIVDTTQGCSILSGDNLVYHFAKELKAQYVVFLSDVDGVFDKNPKNSPDAHLIPSITKDNFQSVLSSLDESSNGNRDVTGEMFGKVSTIKKYLPAIPVYITNGLKAGPLTKVVLKKKFVGTKIYLG